MNFPASITKEEVMELPLHSYPGKIHVLTEAKEINAAMAQISKSKVVGFDTEARPTFKKGQIRNISLIQIATKSEVYLLRIKSTGLMKSIVNFLESDSIMKVGIGLDDDKQLLKRLADFKPANFLDLNIEMPNFGAEKIGARNLAAMLLNIRISKSAQTSNWENPTLTNKQVQYAATDAWICLEIHEKLVEWGHL
jgi:ribonuclease D